MQIHIRLTSLQPDGSDIPIGPEQVATAATLIVAIQHFNSRFNGIVDVAQFGCPQDLEVTFEMFDTESSPASTVQNFLANANLNGESSATMVMPDVVIGATQSSESIPLGVVTGLYDIPQISYASTSTELNDRSVFPFFARTCPPDNTVAVAVANLFNKLGYEYAAILYETDSYGSAYKEALFAECQSLGISLFSASYQVGDNSSMLLALQQLESLKLNVFFGVVNVQDVNTLVAQGNSLGLFGSEKVWYFSDAITSINELSISNPALGKAFLGSFHVYATGLLASNPGYEPFLSMWPSFIEYQDLINAYLPGGSLYVPIVRTDRMEKPYNVSLQINDDFFEEIEPDEYAPFAYDAIMAACFAACRSGLTFPVQSQAMKIQIYNSLLGIQFSGVSGNVSFDSLGNRVNGNIQLYNFQAPTPSSGEIGLQTVDVGGWVNLNWVLDTQAIIYPSGLNSPPPDVTPPSYNKHLLSPAYLGVGYFFFISAMLLCLALLIWTLCYRNSKVVRRSQWQFLVVFLFGNAVSASAILPLTIDTGSTVNLSCMLVPWLYSVGFVITVAALLVKTYRVMRIFENQQLTSVKITDAQLYGLIFLFVAGDIIILALWTAFDPLEWKITVVRTDNYNNPVESYGYCTSNSVGYLVAILLYLLVVLAGGTYMAFKARTIPSSFQESKWISISMISYLQIFVVGVPGIAAVYTIPEARFFLTAIVFWASTLIRVLVIFIPKMIALHENDDEDDLNKMEVPKEKKPQQPPNIRHLNKKPTLDQTVRAAGDTFDADKYVNAAAQSRQKQGGSSSILSLFKNKKVKVPPSPPASDNVKDTGAAGGGSIDFSPFHLGSDEEQNKASFGLNVAQSVEEKPQEVNASESNRQDEKEAPPQVHADADTDGAGVSLDTDAGAGVSTNASASEAMKETIPSFSTSIEAKKDDEIANI